MPTPACPRTRKPRRACRVFHSSEHGVSNRQGVDAAHGVQYRDELGTLQRRFDESLHDAGSSLAAKLGFMRIAVA